MKKIALVSIALICLIIFSVAYVLTISPLADADNGRPYSPQPVEPEDNGRPYSPPSIILVDNGRPY